MSQKVLMRLILLLDNQTERVYLFILSFLFSSLVVDTRSVGCSYDLHSIHVGVGKIQASDDTVSSAGFINQMH